MPEQHLTDFTDRYGPAEFTIVSPGRVNIIGEHTDYKGGRVLPFAIAKTLYITGKINDSHTRAYSTLYKEEAHWIGAQENLPPWTRYISSALNILLSKGYPIKPASIMIGGKLDAGAGISSSSALTCGVLALFNQLNNLQITNDNLIRYASISENSNGVLGGIMDQSCIIKAKKDHALLLDCQNNHTTHIPIHLEAYDWLLINSGVAHNLAETDYNSRTHECHEAMSMLKENFGLDHPRSLIKEHLDYLRMNNSTLAKRMRHFFMEEKRMTAMLRAIERGDGPKIGTLLNECHWSLANLYEVSCKEIDYLIQALHQVPDVLGARMIGGGFGGAVLCLVKKSTADVFMTQIKRKYYSTFKIELTHHLVSPQDGLKVITYA